MEGLRNIIWIFLTSSILMTASQDAVWTQQGFDFVLKIIINPTLILTLIAMVHGVPQDLVTVLLLVHQLYT